MQNEIDLEIGERVERDRPRSCAIAHRRTRLVDTQYHRFLHYLARLFLSLIFKFKNMTKNDLYQYVKKTFAMNKIRLI